VDCKTEQRTTHHPKVLVKDRKTRKIIETRLHRVFVSKIQNPWGKPISCFRNRDKNAVNNMEKIVNSILTTGARPTVFTRKYKLPT